MKVSEWLHANDADNRAVVDIYVKVRFPNARFTKRKSLRIRAEIQEQLAGLVKAIPFTNFGVGSLRFRK